MMRPSRPLAGLALAAWGVRLRWRAALRLMSGGAAAARAASPEASELVAARAAAPVVVAGGPGWQLRTRSLRPALAPLSPLHLSRSPV
jgi:hypothetical protein